MIRFTRRTLIAALAALLPLAAAQAQDIKERTFKFALQNPKGHPLEQGATKFSELVAAKSGGKMKVTSFPAARWAAMRPTCRRCRAAPSSS